MSVECEFCQIISQKTKPFLYADKSVVAFLSSYPVTKGHTLIITRRHCQSFFEIKPEELTSIHQTLLFLKSKIDRVLKPDGYNIGVNDGTAAGQTINHIHIHLIPRYLGDVDDPTGGVRNVIPGKGNYKKLPLSTEERENLKLAEKLIQS